MSKIKANQIENLTGTLLTVSDIATKSVDIASKVSSSALAASSGASLVGYLPAGTGAIPTDVQSKLRADSVTPEDFGAIGNNIADDTISMTAALNEAVSSGRTLNLKDGATYFLNTWTPFTNASFLCIKGNGASTLRGPASTVSFLSPSSNFDVQGVVFSTWASVVSRLLVQSGSFTDVVFSNNSISGCTAPVFNIEKPITQYRIESNNIQSCTGGYGIRIGENTYANEDTWQEGWITNNRINTLSASGVTSAVGILVYGRRTTIANNKIDGVAQSGTGEAWGIYTKSRYGQIFGNFVNNVVPASSGDNVGINIKGNTRAAPVSPQGFSVNCWGNIVSNIGSAGVRGVGIRAQTDDVLVFGNQCEDTGIAGCVSDESSTYRNVTIQNNLVRFATNVAGTTGIRLEGSGTGVVADNNTITNGRNGILVTTGASASTMQDVQVTRNKLFGCTVNLFFDSFSGCTLDRVTFDENVVDGGSFGILFNGSAGTVSNLRIRSNDLSRASSVINGAIMATATTIAYGNLGWLNASATYDPPSIANGASAATTVSVPFASVGDLVTASFSNSLSGLALCAQVSAANTVEVRLINNSGGVVDLASGTLRVAVTKNN